MTATTTATWLREVWSTKPTITYRAETVLVPLMDHTWEPELGVGQGDTVNIPGFSQNASPNNRGAGSGTFGTGASVTFDAVTESQTQLVVNRFYYKAFRIPAEVNAQVMPSYIPLLLSGHGTAISVQVDADLGGDNTNGLDAFSTVVGTDNVDITEDDILTIQTNLDNANAPKDRYIVVSPASRASLMKIEAFRNAMYSSTVGNLPGDRTAGYIAPIHTFGVYLSNNLEAGTAGKKNAGWHKEAIAYAEQLRMQTEKAINIEDGVFDQYITFMTCGFKIVKTSFGNELAGK